MAASKRQYDSGRLIVMEHIEDKASAIQELVDDLTKRTNDSAKGYNLKSVRLTFHNDTGYLDDFILARDPAYARVWIDIDFEKKRPEYIGKNENKYWDSYYNWKENIKKASREHFGGLIGDSLEYAHITFYGDPRKELYVLTPEKEQVIRTGFNGVRGFAAWFCHLVEKFDSDYRRNIDEYYSSILIEEGIPEGTFPIADPDTTRPNRGESDENHPPS